MVLGFPICKNFKCDKECGKQVCQNSILATAPTISIDDEKIIQRYLNNHITKSICIQGLEPFDSFKQLNDFIDKFRQVSTDDIVIYTGYTKEEIKNHINILQQFPNIIIKYGRFIPNDKPHKDNVLGIELSSSNQYAEKIS